MFWKKQKSKPATVHDIVITTIYNRRGRLPMISEMYFERRCAITDQICAVVPSELTGLDLVNALELEIGNAEWNLFEEVCGADNSAAI